MAAQFDFNAGFDPSSLSSITQAQLLQMIQQIAPLSNIGGIIFQAGTSLATTIPQGTGGSPDVTNNPRFARYIWLNTFSAASAPPTPYYYDASTTNWTLVSVAAGSIVNSSISASAEIEVSKLQDGTANQVIRTDGAGTGVEWVSVSTLLSALNDSVPLTAIDDTAAVGAESFLRRTGSTISWKTFAETVTAIQAALSGVSPSIITPGSNNTILGTNGSGVVAFNTPANILANEAITLALLSAGGGSALQVLARNSGNSAWSPQTLALNLLNAATISTTGVFSTAGGTGMIDNAVHTIAHGLGVIPKLVKVAIVRDNAAAEAGWNQNDEVDVNAIYDTGSIGFCSWGADATNITVSQRATSGLTMVPKGGGASVAITENQWKLKVYAWA